MVDFLISRWFAVVRLHAIQFLFLNIHRLMRNKFVNIGQLDQVDSRIPSVCERNLPFIQCLITASLVPKFTKSLIAWFAVPFRAVHLLYIRKKTLFLDAPQHLYNCVCPSVRRSFPPSQLAKSTMSRNNTTTKQPRRNDKSGNKQNSISHRRRRQGKI